MKAKINKKTKEAARKYIKYLAYFMYFYFGWRLIFTPLVFFRGKEGLIEYGGIAWFIFSLILGLVFVVFGLVCAYKLTKFRRWALIALTILIMLHAISIAGNSLLLLSKMKIPLVQIAILIFMIGAFKQLKNAQ